MNWWVAPAGVGADQDRLLLPRLSGELGEREVDHVDLVGGGVGRGVAGPQDRGQRLAGAVTTVQPGRQRVEPEGVLVGAGRALLVGVRGHQGGIQVDHQQPVHPGAGLPGPPAGPHPGQPQSGQPPLPGLGQALDDPPGGWGRGHRTDQPRLVTEHGQVGKAVPTISQHDRQIGQHLAGPVPSPARLPLAHPAIQLGRQPQPVSQPDQQRRPDLPDEPVAIGGDFEPCPRLGSLHPQGALLGWGSRPSDSRILPAQRGHLLITTQPAPRTHENPGLGGWRCAGIGILGGGLRSCWWPARSPASTGSRERTWLGHWRPVRPPAALDTACDGRSHSAA
jgi:hypothetical protein